MKGEFLEDFAHNYRAKADSLIKAGLPREQAETIAGKWIRNRTLSGEDRELLSTASDIAKTYRALGYEEKDVKQLVTAFSNSEGSVNKFNSLPGHLKGEYLEDFAHNYQAKVEELINAGMHREKAESVAGRWIGNQGLSNREKKVLTALDTVKTVEPDIKASRNPWTGSIELQIKGEPSDWTLKRLRKNGFVYDLNRGIYHAPFSDARQAFAWEVGGYEKVRNKLVPLYTSEGLHHFDPSMADELKMRNIPFEFTKDGKRITVQTRANSSFDSKFKSDGEKNLFYNYNIDKAYKLHNERKPFEVDIAELDKPASKALRDRFGISEKDFNNQLSLTESGMGHHKNNHPDMDLTKIKKLTQEYDILVYSPDKKDGGYCFIKLPEPVVNKKGKVVMKRPNLVAVTEFKKSKLSVKSFYILTDQKMKDKLFTIDNCGKIHPVNEEVEVLVDKLPKKNVKTGTWYYPTLP